MYFAANTQKQPQNGTIENGQPPSMKLDIHTCRNGGYTGTFINNNNNHTHHTPVANSYTHVSMLGLGV